ncbi:hypothetical protein [Cupriavidus nantongensis]|uniref:hypothetical protein n=1 Tax=Cupriavidus nantongensis TaxID=1796606 RepID=UPI00358F5ED3
MEAHAGLFNAESFENCILANMPGTAEWAIGVVVLKCGNKPAARPGAGRGLFAKYPNGMDCFLDKGTKVESQTGKGLVFMSCSNLYDKPK